MLEDKVLKELQEYVNGRLERVTLYTCYLLSDIADRCAANGEFEDYTRNNSRPTFGQVLFSFMEEKGAADADVFKRSGIGPGILSRIRCEPQYRPGKNIVIALSMALELSKIQTDRLLGAAGYSLFDSDTLDLVIQFCLEKQIYDMDDVCQALDCFGLKLQ